MSEEVQSEQFIGFLNKITKLQPIEFAGLLKILCISSINEGKKVRPFEELLSELCDRYLQLNEKQRLEIDDLLDKTINPNEKKTKRRKKK